MLTTGKIEKLDYKNLIWFYSSHMQAAIKYLMKSMNLILIAFLMITLNISMFFQSLALAQDSAEGVVKKDEGVPWDKPTDVAIDPSGDVYVTGFSYSNATGYDYVTIKYDANGNELWIRRYNNGAGDYAFALTLDSSDNVYVTGFSYSNSTGYDYVTIKYDTDGNELWVNRYNYGDNDRAVDINVDPSGNIYVAGFSYSNSTGYDCVTIKYDTDGNELWVNRYDHGDNDRVVSLAVDSSGNVYVTGFSYSNSTGYSYVTVKYDTYGDELLVNSYDSGENDRADDLGVASSDNICIGNM
ncbi:MAG: hypothetical protein A3G39_01665 [Deltaproteobacteria bacterium RIFCSPLOWO2_12_FULL_43_16]|nr:MAG: hypothetical protein A2Z89_09560 [Deltaproteobacteria bacterium GWA2_43_19]OGQ09557.1 MAG: hypothetical protein A3D30_05070 [Deltaproteobacteria bacterium RIFCSPHIGHO2_02_FULL_43_33]OGQ58569.1 MAG: hypothetical protein A3G39_01665 [Deltaproteobacteria bacterium RIFCSPLOWO2_12_FULL_43_16]HBR18307.1 hypothetical protein [Deltaproteobacteria bacterium]